MGLARQLDDLHALEQRFQELCESLVYKPGSIFRIANQYLANWGIGADEENRAFIDRSSTHSYFQEWRRGTKESNDAIHRAVNGANLPYSNPDLNLEIGLMATEIIRDLAKTRDRIVIADVGAGAGDTTVALLDFLDMADVDGSLVSRCHFYLLEPSITRLVVAQEVLQSHAINSKRPVDFTLVSSNHKTHLPMVSDGVFDVVITNAVCHHMTFPDYIGDFQAKLADDGVLVMGDWFTVIWSQPAFVLELMRQLGMSAREQQKFEYVFGVKKGDRTALENELAAYQRESNRMMMDFELSIANEFRKIPEESRLFFLEAHESLEDRVHKLECAGFETDIDELRAKHRAFLRVEGSIKNLFPNSDFASVVAAAKIPGHSPKRDRDSIRRRVETAILR